MTISLTEPERLFLLTLAQEQRRRAASVQEKHGVMTRSALDELNIKLGGKPERETK